MIRAKIDILVVDDDVSHCTILQALLRGWGYDVALAYSGRAALEQVREHVRESPRASCPPFPPRSLGWLAKARRCSNC